MFRVLAAGAAAAVPAPPAAVPSSRRDAGDFCCCPDPPDREHDNFIKRHPETRLSPGKVFRHVKTLCSRHTTSPRNMSGQWNVGRGARMLPMVEHERCTVNRRMPGIVYCEFCSS